MKNNNDNEQAFRIRNRKSEPVNERFDVLSGLDEYMEERNSPVSVMPPTLKTGERPW